MRFDGLWRHRDFRRLWAAQTISVFGTMISGTALPFTAILALDASPFEVALLAACRIIPALALGPFAGVWLDRVRKRGVMMACDAGRAALLVTIPLAYLLDALTLEHLFAVALGVSAMSMVFDVAYRSYLPSLVTREELLEGNSKLTASSAAAEFGGFSVGGWLVQAVNGPFAIFIDALSFVWSGAFLRTIEQQEPAPVKPEERTSVRAEIGEGLSTVVRQPLLRAMAGSTALFSVGFGLFGATYMLFVTRELGFHPGVLGVIFGLGGLSSLAGAVVAERAASRIGVGMAMIVGLTMMGVSMFFVPAAQGATIAGASLLIAQQLFGDGGFTMQDVNYMSLRQAITPSHLLGRVNSFFYNLDLVAMLAGTLIGGVLGEIIGLRPTLVVGAALTLAAAAVLVASPIASLRRTPPSSDAAAEPLAGEA